MIQNEENQEENSILPIFLNPLAEDRRQVKFCQKLIANLFEKGESPCKREFQEVKIKRQLLDHYLKRICNLHNKMEFTPLKSAHLKHFIIEI